MSRRGGFKKINWWEAIGFGVLMIITILVRVVGLEKIPWGLHGDEAWTGLDAWEIVQGKKVPIYTGHALGQPTGPLYITALVFKILGPSIMSLRLSMALFGIASVGIFYWVLREFFEWRVAWLGTLGMSLSLYHLHYSRLGFMMISALLFQSLALGLYFKFLSKQNNWWLISSAAFVGLGVYSYNSFLFFAGVMVGVVGLMSWLGKDSIKKGLMFGLVTLIVAWPLVRIIIFQPDFYFSHYRLYSVWRQKEFQLLESKKEKIGYVVKTGLKNIKQFYFGGKLDYSDGFGAKYTFNFWVLSLAGWGLFYVIKTLVIKRGNKVLWFMVISFAILHLSFFSYIDAVYRRGNFLVFYIFWFYAWGLAYWFKKWDGQIIKQVGLISLVIIMGLGNGIFYFRNLMTDRRLELVFIPSMVEVGKKVSRLSLGEGDKIWFYSNSHSCKYETFRFLTDNHNCTDLSREFGKGNKPDFKSGDVVVVLGSYLTDRDLDKKLSKESRGKITVSKKGKLLGLVYKL